jgi:hypothetical protein
MITWIGLVAVMGEIRIAHIFVRKPGDLGVDGRILFEWFVERQG